MIPRLAMLLVLLTIADRSLSPAQGEAAVPFLLISPAPDGNGMGNISTAVASDNLISSIANPGQLGLFSLDRYLGASTYSNKTSWLPGFASPITYNAWAFAAGLNLKDPFCLPFGLSVGLAYSGVDLDLGTFIRTGSGGPDPIGTFEAFEESRNMSLAVGFESVIRLGLGWNFKDVRSHIGPIGPAGQEEVGEAQVSTTDFGLLLEVPCSDVLAAFRGEQLTITGDVAPLFDLSFGYSVSNRGDKTVSYIQALQSDPFPRFAIVGMGLEVGITKPVSGSTWKILTFTLAREADDLLVDRDLAGSSMYQRGFGDISFFRNVIGGKADTNGVNSRKGWQLNVAELIYLRGGSYSELPGWGNRNYSTEGFGLRLLGVFRFLETVSPGLVSEGAVGFIARHIDIIYDHAFYSSHPLLGGTSFNALTFHYR